MTEPENTDVNTEIVAPAVEESPQANHEEQTSEVQNQPEESDKERNFAAMRERQDALERRLEEKDLEIQAIRQEQQQAQPLQEEPEVDELDSISGDEWLTKEQSEKLATRQANTAVDKALEKDRIRRAKEEFPDRIKKDFPDFDQVVSKENVNYLKANKPHLAAALAATQDLLAQAEGAYDAIKMYCPSIQVTQDKERAEKNASRPGTLDAAGPARVQESDPKRINPDTQARYWKDMQEAARG